MQARRTDPIVFAVPAVDHAGSGFHAGPLEGLRPSNSPRSGPGKTGRGQGRTAAPPDLDSVQRTQR
jgi:hypothetical protein